MNMLQAATRLYHSRLPKPFPNWDAHDHMIFLEVVRLLQKGQPAFPVIADGHLMNIGDFIHQFCHQVAFYGGTYSILERIKFRADSQGGLIGSFMGSKLWPVLEIGCAMVKQAVEHLKTLRSLTVSSTTEAYVLLCSHETEE